MFLVKYLFLSQSTWPLAQSSGSMTPDRFKCTVLKYKYGWGRRFRWQHTKLVSFKLPSLTSRFLTVPGQALSNCEITKRQGAEGEERKARAWTIFPESSFPE